MMAIQAVLSVTGLQKRVHGRSIVKNVSFEVFPGEIFGFLGPNGAGKTTTIRMLVGLIRPTAGRIFVSGHNLRTQPQRALRQVGCIVENPDLYPYLTGYENLLQLARMQGPRAVRRIESVAELVDLSHRIDDKVGTYSLGMRQRLGIAQALLCDPKLLILDEPTNGLDPSGIQEMRQFLRQLATDGLGILVSSHLLAEMELMCDRVAILQDGEIVRSGAVNELLDGDFGLLTWRVRPIETAANILEKFAQDVEITDDCVRCQMHSYQVSRAVSALVASGCLVDGIDRQTLTLEDVFMKTTGEVRRDISASRSQ